MEIDFITHSDSDFIRAFVYETITGPTPIDLTGSNIEMMVRHHASDPTAYITVSTMNGQIVITNPTAGMFTITIPFAQLNALPENTYDQSCIRLRPDGFRDEIWYGKLTHTIGPTR